MLRDFIILISVVFFILWLYALTFFKNNNTGVTIVSVTFMMFGFIIALFLYGNTDLVNYGLYNLEQFFNQYLVMGKRGLNINGNNFILDDYNHEVVERTKIRIKFGSNARFYSPGTEILVHRSRKGEETHPDEFLISYWQNFVFEKHHISIMHFPNTNIYTTAEVVEGYYIDIAGVKYHFLIELIYTPVTYRFFVLEGLFPPLEFISNKKVMVYFSEPIRKLHCFNSKQYYFSVEDNLRLSLDHQLFQGKVILTIGDIQLKMYKKNVRIMYPFSVEFSDFLQNHKKIN